MGCEFEVAGRIAERWRARGGADGPFGCPAGPERDLGGGVFAQSFTGGEIAWSGPQEMVVSVHRMRNEACFEWEIARGSGYHYEFFRYEVGYQPDGGAMTDQGLSRLEIRGRQRLWSRLQGFGTYAFRVQGCDGDEARQGWTVPVHVHLGPAAEGLPPEGGHPVVGVIGERWHELGAWSGPLGRAVEDEVFNPANGVRLQRFERGSITTAPDFGPGMVVAAYQRGRSLEITWGGADRPFNAFRVDVWANGKKFREQLVVPDPSELARPGTGGRLRLAPWDLRGNGPYWVYIHPTMSLDPFAKLAPNIIEPDVAVIPVATTPDDFRHIVDFPFGGTPQAHVVYDYGPVDADLGVVAVDGSAEHAYVSHDVRATEVARHFACTRPLFAGHSDSTEDLPFQLIAHLHMVRQDPGFRAPGELPSRWLAPSALHEVVLGKVGTKADYDMTLKGLMTVLYRYGDLLSDADIDFVCGELTPPELLGPWRIFDMLMQMTYNFGPFTGPETENHLLMIETSRYLVNQLLFRRTGDPHFGDTGEIKVRDWLLGYLHTIAQHDFQEFNARPYQRLSIHALLNLYEFAGDEDIRTAARIVLDYAMVKFAVSSDRQRRVGPFRRLHENAHSVGPERHALVRNRRGDPHTGFGLQYSGPSEPDGRPQRWLIDEWAAEALLVGLSNYRPPAAAYRLTRPKDVAPYQHRFHHGQRAPLSGFPPPEAPDPGVEIYYRSRSFLLSAGGVFLNSGYGHDEFTSYDHVVYALPTALLPTRGEVTFADLIQFSPWPNNRDGRNNGVHENFACGMNLHIPDPLARRGEAHGNWLFLDLTSDLGFQVAAYRQPAGGFELPLIPSVPLNDIGFLYVEEAGIPFAEFRDRTLARNQHLGTVAFGTHVFHTPQDVERRLTFRLDPFVDRYAATVLAVDDHALAADLRQLPLAEGPYLSGGHDGRVEVRQPDCATPVVLDYRDAAHPVIEDHDCPMWLADVLRAYGEWAVALLKAHRPAEALATTHTGIAYFHAHPGLDDEPLRRAAAAFLDLATVAHPHDLPTQHAAGRNAHLTLAAVAQRPGDQLTVGKQLDQAARYLAFGSPTMTESVEVSALARTVYAGLDGDHRLDLGASWATQAFSHHETAHHRDNPDKATELTRQRQAAAEAATFLFPLAEEPAPADPERLARLLHSLIGTLSFGGTDSAPSARAASLAARAWAQAPGDHRLDIAEEYTTLAQRHHEIGALAGLDEELLRQREAATQAAEVLYPMAEGPAMPTPGAEARLAGMLTALIGWLTFGTAESAPSVRAADLARRVWGRMTDRDHGIDIAATYSKLAQRHHLAGAHPNQPNPAAEFHRQRKAAEEAVIILLALADVTPVAEPARIAGLLADTTNYLTFGLPDDDPEAPTLRDLARRATETEARLRTLLA
jgi:hypothetical protein